MTVTLDDEQTRLFAQTAPISFLQQAGDGLLVIDEVQRVPGLILPSKPRSTETADPADSC